MLIASMIVKVLPEKAIETEKLMEQYPNVTTYGVHKDNNIIIVVEANDAQELESLSRRIMNAHEAVLGVFPTYVTTDEEK